MIKKRQIPFLKKSTEKIDIIPHQNAHFTETQQKTRDKKQHVHQKQHFSTRNKHRICTFALFVPSFVHFKCRISGHFLYTCGTTAKEVTKTVS